MQLLDAAVSHRKSIFLSALKQDAYAEAAPLLPIDDKWNERKKTETTTSGSTLSLTGQTGSPSARHTYAKIVQQGIREPRDRFLMQIKIKRKKSSFSIWA